MPIVSESADELHRVTMKNGLCGGRPTLRGMRIRVQDVLDLLAAGATRQEILDDYPYLEDGDITASLQYAARQLDHPVLAAE
jgi:uncharacterized protein (DUF433 family)